MRGALETLDGIEISGLEPKNKVFEVKYNSKKTQIDAILAALQTAGRPAKKIE